VNIPEQFAQNLGKIRSERGITQAQLALDAGLDVSFMNEIERAKRNVSIETAAKLAKALDVEITDLLKDVRLG